MSSTSTPKNVDRHSSEITANRDNIRLVYLDQSEPSLNIQSHLLQLNPVAQIYTDLQLCVDFLQTIYNEEIFLIISNLFLADHILYSIHSVQSILGIFIYDDQQPSNELKTKYSKIIGIYTNPNELFNSVEDKMRLIEKQILIFSLFDPKRQDLTRDSASFLWHYMIMDILKQIPQHELKRDEILNKCSQYYRANCHALDRIELFRQSYTSEQAIHWYTNESLLYKLVNRALRVADIEFLYSFQFFLVDLSLQVEQRYQSMRNENGLIVYRALFMSDEEIDKLKRSIGCLISMDGFLLASYNKTTSLSLFQQPYILFEIHVDSSIEATTLADISSGEHEILFNINSLFKIDSVEYDAMDNFWQVKLIASNERIKQVNEYLNWIQKESDYQSSLVYFGHLLWNDLSQMNQAKNYFQILLKLLPNDHVDIPEIYRELGSIYDEMKEYNLALNKYQYALNLRQKQIPNDHLRIGFLLDSIGTVYSHMGNLDRAIDFYGQALYICETKCAKTKNQLHRANTIANLGLAYRDKNDFVTALTYLTLAYDIRRDVLPKEHRLLVNALSSIGSIHHKKNDLDQALDYYQQALAMKEITCPDDHSNKATIIRNIGLIFLDKQDWQNALNSFHRTLEMRQRLLPNVNHPDIASCYGDIGTVYERMNNFDLALDNYHQQLQIEERCLPFTHSNLILHLDSIVTVLKKNEQPGKALHLCQEKLSRLKHILDADYESHPRIARILVLIATIYEDENPKQADQHYQQALAILEKKKNEEVLQICLSPMTNFYWKCRMFDRALICQMKLLNIRRSTLTSNHDDIAYTLQGLARLYRAMNKSTEALDHFQQSLAILQGNYGPDHVDVKNIQQEMFDLKAADHSLAATADDDYTNRRLSNIHKELVVTPSNYIKSPPTTNERKQQQQQQPPPPSRLVSKSGLCVII